MKVLLPFLIIGLCICHAEQPEVSVQLASARTEYRTHDNSATPGFNLKFELTPAPGISFCDTDALTPELTVTDTNGTIHKAAIARLITTDSGKAYASFSTKKRPTGHKVSVEGTLHIRIAKGLTKHTPVKIDLIHPSDLHLGNETIKIVPAAANASAANREGERLRRAELTLQYRAELNISHIARQWFPDAAPEPDFSQNVDFETTLSEDQTTKTTTFILVDVLSSASLQISTCTEEKSLQLPIKFELGLSEAINHTPGEASLPSLQP
ncbi:MAG: hypothetical protein E7033_01200 [Akkermansiaceae bacterium]|nr:hypothetical protein [Akkermansiaceae bacterium]